MDIHKDISLKNYTTMKLGGNASFLADAHDPEQLRQLVLDANNKELAIWVLGGGSNVIATDEGFGGLIIRIRIPGFQVLEETSSHTTLRIGAGENWDNIVKKTVDMNLTGIEALSGIPGTAGATPVQNVGAYGQEIADTFEYLEAYDIANDEMVSISHDDCKFSYRDSIFRGEWAGRFIITAIVLKLSKNLPQPPFYSAITNALEERNITLFTPATIREVVLQIRQAKLPDPTTKPNAGSFFKNAIVDSWRVGELQKTYPDIPVYEMANNTFKVSSGWLIEQAGLKGELLHGIRVNQANALVLINESATSYNDLALARQQILTTVYDKFGILMEQEPLQIA